MSAPAALIIDKVRQRVKENFVKTGKFLEETTLPLAEMRTLFAESGKWWLDPDLVEAILALDDENFVAYINAESFKLAGVRIKCVAPESAPIPKG